MSDSSPPPRTIAPSERYGREIPPEIVPLREDGRLTRAQKKEAARRTAAQKFKQKAAEKKEAHRVKRAEHVKTLGGTDKEERKAAAKAQRAAALEQRQREKELFERACAQKLPTIAVNCSFESVMNRKECISLVQQLQLCMSHWKRQALPVRLMLTSLSPGSAITERVEQNGGGGWPAVRVPEDYWAVAAELLRDGGGASQMGPPRGGLLEAGAGSTARESATSVQGAQSAALESAFSESGAETALESHETPKVQIIVLSPDGDEVLNEVPQNAMYVIGGLVDRTVSKYQTLSQAKADAAAALGASLRIVRLPLREHGIASGISQVLNVDTVCSILLRRLAGEEWFDALKACVPKRCGGIVEQGTEPLG